MRPMNRSLLMRNRGQLPGVVGVWQSRGWRCIPSMGVVLSLCFCIFLYPFSCLLGGDGVSVNYLFILFPAIIILARGKFQLPSRDLLATLILYVLVFVLATIYQFSYFDFFYRRVASFIIFISMFAYMFIKIDSQMVRSFKCAIVAISIYFSLYAIFLYFSLGGADLGMDAKGVIGSQRYGFVYVLAIWLLLHYFPRNIFLSALKFVGLLLLGAGLLLTFSRASIVAIVGSAGIYIASKILDWVKSPKLQNRRFLTVVCVILSLSVIILLLNKYFFGVFNFYLDRLFSLKQKSGENTFDFSNPAASEGFRVVLFHKIVEFVACNPFTGSGYLGVWILFADLSGSAHNQYLDVLFRTGIFGFSVYVFLLYRLLRFLCLREPGLFWGLIGVLIFGLVHETFKLSHGLFILSFLFGMMGQPRFVKHHNVLIA